MPELPAVFSTSTERRVLHSVRGSDDRGPTSPHARPGSVGSGDGGSGGAAKQGSDNDMNQVRFDLYIPAANQTNAPDFHIVRFVNTNGGPGQLPYPTPDGLLWMTTIPRHDMESARMWATWYLHGPGYEAVSPGRNSP